MKVKYIGCTDDQAHCGLCGDPRPVLIVGNVYNVIYVDIHKWYTVYKTDFGKFNSECFREVSNDTSEI